MNEEVKAEEAGQKVETKNVDFRITLKVDDSEKCCYMQVAGVPKDLPKEYDITVAKAAEMQFAKVIEERRFLELYNPGKTAMDEQPVFYNLDKFTTITVVSVEQLDLTENK